MGQSDSPLTPTGVAQAEAVAKRLAQRRIDAIYSSDLGRAASTSRIISQACGLPVINDRRLRERHAGLLQGKLESEARIKHAIVFDEIARRGAAYVFPGGGESGLQIEERMASFLDEVQQDHPGETSVLLWHILGFPYASIFRLQCDNTSINAISSLDVGWIVESWNDTAHLELG
jgi:broad specificity phosphatase PhoE